MATRFNGGIIGVRNSTTVGLTTGRFSSNEVLLSLKDGTWPIPPVNLTVPVVTGTAQDGETLTSTTGTWSQSPTSFAYQWQRGTSDIGGATSSTYNVVAADVGSTLRCVVTATNTSGSTSAASANTTTVIAQTQGQLWITGLGTGVGTLGRNRTDENASSPIQVGSATNWTSSVVRSNAILATNSLGQLWAWGGNNKGQLGLGDTINRSSPVQVGVLTNWKKVKLGLEVCGAIKTDGTLWMWGDNSYGGGGQLGLSDTTNRSSPVQVGSDTNWSDISVCGRFGGSFATKTTGTLWSWGRNNNGQLGLNDTTNRSVPTQVGGSTNWSSVFGSGQYSGCFSIKTDGTLWSWGANNYGALGLDNTSNRSSPVQVGALTDWSTLRGGSSYSQHGLKTNGTLWGWGKNGASYGALGLDDTVDRSSPVQVGSLTTWSKIATADVSGCQAIKTNGTLWVWGAGTSGGLGLNDTDNRSSPVQLGSLTTWVIPGPGGRSEHSTFIKTP